MYLFHRHIVNQTLGIMKMIALLLSFFMLPLIGTTSAIYPTSALSGVWKSECGTLTLIIEANRRGLQVRDYRSGRWTFYDQARGRSNTYNGPRSKTLRIRNQGIILFEDRARRSRLTLRKQRLRGNSYDRYRGSYNSYDRYDRDRAYGGSYNRGYDRGSIGLIGSYDAKKLRKSIDDKWINREYRVEIKIKDTDSGIKMKRDGFREYTYYLQDRRNPQVFADSNGNSIEIRSKYEIVWYDARRGRALYFIRD